MAEIKAPFYDVPNCYGRKHRVSNQVPKLIKSMGKAHRLEGNAVAITVR